MAKPPPPRPRRTKTTLERDRKTLEGSLDKEKAEETVKGPQVVAEEGRVIRETVHDVSPDTVAQRMTALSLDVSKTLSMLAEKLNGEVTLLDNVRRAVTLETQELERLHGRDVVASSLEELLEEYREKKATLETEMKVRQEEWQAQQDLRARQLREQEEELRRQRQREKEEYEYQKALERKKDQDKYDEEKKLRDRTLKEREEALGKDWAAREALLKEREQELAALKAEVDKFPGKLQAEVTRAVADAVKAQEEKAKQQLVLLQKDRDTDKQVAVLRIAALEETVARQSAQIESLQGRLEDARVQVREIAVQAIEGASGARALAHINQIAMEQAKHRAPGS